jgi:hypothetical protein
LTNCSSASPSPPARLGRLGRPGTRLELLEDPVQQELALRRLELLRVLLGVRELAQAVENCSRSGSSTAESRAFSRIAAKLGESARFVMSSSVEASTRTARGSRRAARRRPRLLDAVLGDRRANVVAMCGVELGREVDVDPLRLADLLAEALQRRADLADLGVRQLERLEDRSPPAPGRRPPPPS